MAKIISGGGRFTGVQYACTRCTAEAQAPSAVDFHEVPMSSTSRDSQGPTYRADIDGLRALAVIAVILFHSDIPGFQGGYIGVDIFFVISGYLITQLLEGL